MTDEAHLGMAVDAPGDVRVVDGHRVLAEQVADGEHALGEAHMRERGCGDEVAHRPHAGLGGAAAFVDDHVTAVGDLHGGALDEAVRVGAATDRDHDHVDRDGLTLAERHRGATGELELVALHLYAGAHVDAALLERPQHHSGDVLVATGQDLRQRLEDGHRRAEVGHHRCELATDGAAADDHGTGRQGLQRQQLVGGDDRGAVDIEAGDGARHRAGGEDHVGAAQFHVAGGAAAHAHDVVGVQGAEAVEHSDLALLEQTAEPGDEAVHHTLLPGLGDGEVEFGFAGAQAEGSRRCDGPPDRGRLQQFLGRDAAHVQTGAADAVLLDQRDGETGRGAVERRGVATGTAADDDDVEVLSRGDHLRGDRSRSILATGPSPPIRLRTDLRHCCAAARPCWSPDEAAVTVGRRRISTSGVTTPCAAPEYTPHRGRTSS